MKKFKILALVMTCAILLSSFAIIPVSAEQGAPYDAADATSASMTIDGKNDESIIKIPDCKNKSYLYMKNANVIPQIKITDNTKFFSTFLSIREIHNIAHNHMFLYIDFETVYKWIKKHRTEIDTIAFDPFAKYDYAWYINIDDFINQIELVKKFVKNYKGKNLVSDLHTIALQKHTPK